MKILKIIFLGLILLNSSVANAAYRLAPEDFNKMYYLASTGNSEALRNAIHRGLDINTVNQSGDTGLCIAMLRNDVKAFNTLREVGANTNHSCIYKRYEQYKKFIDDVNNSKIEDDDNSYLLWALGGAVVGGAALALSGGGGSSGCNNSNGKYTTSTDCANANVGMLCTLDSSCGCYVTISCDEEQFHFDSKMDCLEANPGYTCALSNENGCYVKYDELMCLEGYKTCSSAADWQTLTQEGNGVFYGDNECQTCTYTCNEGYFYTLSECEADGYNCEQLVANNLKCYNAVSAVSCPYSEQLTGQCPELLNTIFTGEIATNNKSGGEQCYECIYACDEAKNYYDSAKYCGNQTVGTLGWELTNIENGCGSCVEKSCSNSSASINIQSTANCISASGITVDGIVANGYSGDSQCNYCQYSCNESTYFTEYDNCIEGGYVCEYSSNISGTGVSCYVNTGVASGCSTGEVLKTSCSSSTGIIASFSGSGEYSGGVECGTCSYSCDSDSGYATSVSSCGSVSSGWTLLNVDSSTGCGKCTQLSCESGYSTTTKDESYCYNSLSDINILEYDGLDYSGYSGNTQCSKCLYECNESTNFSKITDCEAAGYTCEKYDIDNTGTYCYASNGGVASCPTGETLESSCSSVTGATASFSASGSYSGTTRCGDCSYSCATGWTSGTSCPSGETCGDTITSPIECIEVVTCASGQVLSAASCGSTGTGGWSLTGVDSSTGCGTCTAKSCPTGYTKASSFSGCSTTTDLIAVSESTHSSSYAGDESCKICLSSCNESSGAFSTESSCESSTQNKGFDCFKEDTTNCWVKDSCPKVESDTSITQDEYIECPDVDGMTYTEVKTTDKLDSTTSPLDQYYCYKCNYSCNETTGFADEDECIAKHITCTEVSSATNSDGSLQTNGATCWVSTASLSAISGLSLINNENITLFLDDDSEVIGMDNTLHGLNLINDTEGSINISGEGTGSAIGMLITEGTQAINRGEIIIDTPNATAIGIKSVGANTTIINEGLIDVTGYDAYGIYVEDGTGASVINSGTINVNGVNAYGIYVDSNSEYATIYNTGEIFINDIEQTGTLGITLNGASLYNYSLMSFDGDVNLDDLGGTIYVEDGGVFEADSLSGNIVASVDTVMGTNEDEYILSDSVVSSDNSNLNVSSESILFNATIVDNNIVQTRKDFDEFTLNSSMGKFLESNYSDDNLIDMFDELKYNTTSDGLETNIAEKLGADILPNFSDENFQVMRSYNRNIADNILAPTEEDNRVIAGYDNISIDSKTKNMLSGYDLSANSMYTFGDTKLDNYSRLGLGLGFSNISTSYDNGGSRDLSTINIFVPYLYKFSNNLSLASILSLGYGYGEYERSNDYSSDINNLNYGFTNELRHIYDLYGLMNIESSLMLNLLGYYDDGFKEDDGKESLITKSTNNLSIEAGIGMFLTKSLKTEKYGTFNFKAGGIYYRELGSPYDDITATMLGANGTWYNIDDYANLYKRNRAILEAAIGYNYDAYSIYLKYNKLLQENNSELIDIGVRYNF